MASITSSACHHMALHAPSAFGTTETSDRLFVSPHVRHQRPCLPCLRTTDSKDQLEDAGSTVLKTMLDKVEVLRDKGE